jgi:hypothetical protein
LLQKLLERTKEMGRLLSSGPRNVMKIAQRGRSPLMTLTPLISARPDLDPGVFEPAALIAVERNQFPGGYTPAADHRLFAAHPVTNRALVVITTSNRNR